MSPTLEPVQCLNTRIQTENSYVKSRLYSVWKEAKFWLFGCGFQNEKRSTRPWILSPKVKSGKTSFSLHWIEYQHLPTLTYSPLALCHTLHCTVTVTTHTSTHPFIETTWPSQPKTWVWLGQRWADGNCAPPSMGHISSGILALLMCIPANYFICTE